MVCVLGIALYHFWGNSVFVADLSIIHATFYHWLHKILNGLSLVSILFPPQLLLQKCLLLICFLSGRNFFCLSLLSSSPSPFPSVFYPPKHKDSDVLSSLLFVLFISQALTLLGKDWSLTDMEYQGKCIYHLNHRDESEESSQMTIPEQRCVHVEDHTLPSVFAVCLAWFSQWLVEVKHACEFNSVIPI